MMHEDNISEDVMYSKFEDYDIVFLFTTMNRILNPLGLNMYVEYPNVAIPLSKEARNIKFALSLRGAASFIGLFLVKKKEYLSSLCQVCEKSVLCSVNNTLLNGIVTCPDFIYDGGSCE